MAIKFLKTKYNRTLESLSKISYTEGSNGYITAYVPFSATSFNDVRSSAEVDKFGKQWCTIDGVQQYGLNENIYILKLRLTRNNIYDSFQNITRTAVISGVFGTKNENMSFGFEFEITQVGCIVSGSIGGDLVLWKLSGSTDTFSKIESSDPWRGNNYGVRVIGSNEIVESKLKAVNCVNLSGFYSGQYLLTSSVFEDCDFSNVTTFSNMFYGCQQLESIDISDWDFSSASNLEAMFSGCKSLTSITFPSISSPDLKNISSLFMNCSSLTNVDITGIDTKNVTTMANLFLNCSSLETVDLSGLSTSNCTNMINMFNGCTSLTSLDLREFDVSSCKTFSGMFNMCQSLTNIIGGETEICGSMVMIGANKSIDISSTNLDLASIVAIFFGVDTLEEGSDVYIKINRTQHEVAKDYFNVAKVKNWNIITV